MTMENGSEGRAMRRLASELAMCSTCSGIVFKFESTAVDPNPQEEEEVVADVTEPEKMRDLMKAVLLHGPLQKMEPAGATKKQWKVLRQRRRIMMETRRCPTCSGPLIEACPTSLSEDEECLEFMSQGGEGTKKIATEDEAMLADARSEHTLKRSREEGKRSSSGLNDQKKKEAKCEDKKVSGSRKATAKRSNKMEGSGSREVKMKGSRLDEEVTMDMKSKMNITRMLKKALEIEDSELSVGNRKTKMVTKRLDKKSIDFLVENRPLRKPIHCPPFADFTSPSYEVNCVFRDYLQCHSFIKGYGEYQVEVTDDEGDDHKLV